MFSASEGGSVQVHSPKFMAGQQPLNVVIFETLGHYGGAVVLGSSSLTASAGKHYTHPVLTHHIMLPLGYSHPKELFEVAIPAYC